jgi:hypothetical protein
MRTAPLYLLLFLLLPVLSSAQVYPLENANTLGGGGGTSSDGAAFLHDTIGVPFAGVGAATGYEVRGGFWFVVDEIHIGPTSVVLISSFEAEWTDDGMRLSWAVAAAEGLVGFNVYRAGADGERYARVNDDIIPAAWTGAFVDRDVLPGETYYYRLGAIDNDGEFYSQALRRSVPRRKAALYQNYPNPFNPATTIAFYLPASSRAVLSIYDVHGALVASLLDGTVAAGRHEVEWDGRNAEGGRVGTGVYFYELRAGARSMTRKLMVLK